MNTSFEKQRQEWTEEQLRDTARLIYDTDPYIYPAMFSDRPHAEEVISRMFLAGDSMFCLDNLFTAMEDDRVIGIILWVRGSLIWSPEICIRCGGDPKRIEMVKAGYFDTYKQMPPDTVSMINISVRESFRGKGIGRKMMEAFFQQVSGPYELVVLKENLAAIHLYKKMGFKITDVFWGFGQHERDVECYQMNRDI